MVDYNTIEIPAFAEERFLNTIHVAGPDDCWYWMGAVDPDGYGRFSVRLGGRTRINLRAHGWALIKAGHPRPSPQHMALHSCDAPDCCNPAHLRWGTNLDNMRDAVARDRMSKGEHHPPSRLTEDQVKAIRADQRPTRTIARDYGVYPYTIRLIRERRTWRHVA